MTLSDHLYNNPGNQRQNGLGYQSSSIIDIKEFCTRAEHAGTRGNFRSLIVVEIAPFVSSHHEQTAIRHYGSLPKSKSLSAFTNGWRADRVHLLLMEPCPRGRI